MNFLEANFKFIALLITVATSVIFVSYMVLRKKINIENDNSLHVGGLIVLAIYELAQFMLLVIVFNNVILKAYAIFLIVSISMVLSAGGMYLYTYLRLKEKHEKELKESKVKDVEVLE